jgi:hypothetical protein
VNAVAPRDPRRRIDVSYDAEDSSSKAGSVHGDPRVQSIRWRWLVRFAVLPILARSWRAAQTLMCVAVAAGVAPGHASADAITVTTLADTTTLNPLGGGPFAGFSRDQMIATSIGPALDGDLVVFIGGNTLHPGSPFAVAAAGGAITSIANDDTLMPGEFDLPTAEFVGFGGFSLDGDTVVFQGIGFK